MLSDIYVVSANVKWSSERLVLFSYRATLFTPSFRRRRVINRESTLERVSALFSLRTHTAHTHTQKEWEEEERRGGQLPWNNARQNLTVTLLWEICGYNAKNPLDDRALGLEWKAAKGESACSLFPISNRPFVVLTHPLHLPGSRRTFSDANE